MNNISFGSARRHQVIVDLVRDGGVRSQETLARLLRRRGIAVAQPTLSRDVRELGLVKTPAGYALAEVAAARPPAGSRQARLARALRTFATSVRAAGSLVVVKTPPAAAQPIARALDEAGLSEIAGTIAGDDTVFVATSSERIARGLERRLAALVSEREVSRPA